MKRVGRVALRLVVGFVLVVGGKAVCFGQIVINEIMYDPSVSGDTNAEWFELYNAGATAVDIDGWIVKDDLNASETHTINNGGPLSIGAGQFLVLGRNSDKTLNGGVTVNYVYSSVNLSNSTDGLILEDPAAATPEQDRVVWGSSNGFPDPSNSASIALKGGRGTPGVDLSNNVLDNNVGSNWCISTKEIVDGGDAGTPGAENSDCLITPAFTGEIWGIQGSGGVSPHVRAESVTTNDNVVTAIGAGGFFIQTPASRSDNDPDTSDGIFVDHAGTPTVTVGDQVDVSGTVEEYFGFTRFASGATVTIDASNQPLPAFVEFNAGRPAPNPASANCAMEPECYEGMRIRIASGTVTGPSQSFSSDSIAEMYVRPTSGRAFREPGVRYPGVSGRPEIPVWDGNPEVFELDPDKLGLSNASWDPGATFSAEGVLGYEFGGYELWATEYRLLGGGIVLPQAVRAKEAGEVTVASLNLLNLRETSPDLKYEKLSLYIRELLGSPDVIGVQEVYRQAALAKLATRISTDDSNVVYTAYVRQTANSQAVGFLVRSGVTVETGSPTEHGAGETFVDPRDNTNDPVHDRLPLMLEASVGDFAFTVIDIHNRSLIGIDEVARGGWIRAKRLAQAQSVARLVQQQNVAGARVIVVGDYNAFQFTDGYVDVVGQIKGNPRPSRNVLWGPDLVEPSLCNLVDGLPAAQQYSLHFEGSSQALDHALINQPMSRHVVEMQYGRGNTDAAGENEETANALASSDHDGLVVYLSTKDRGRSVCPVGLEDRFPGSEFPPTGGTADLSLNAKGRVVSPGRVHYRVRVDNAGPEMASNVVVKSIFSGDGGPVEAATAGCEEDPRGVPDCTLGDILPDESKSFTIDVDTGGPSEGLLTYRASVDSDAVDRGPDDDDVDIGQPLGPPNAPSDLVATAISSTAIELRWRDNSRVETQFDVFMQGPGDPRPRLAKSLSANRTATVVGDLVANVTYNFVVEARNGELRSGRTPVATATTWADARLQLDAQGEVVSEELVRYTVSVRNAGPDHASLVVVTSSLMAAEGSFVASTSGCLEDPGGVSECSLEDVAVGATESFTIDVEIDAESRNSLAYSGTVSDIADPKPHDDTVQVVLTLGRPEAPSDLQATTLSGTEVELRWRDNSDRETGFGVFLRGPGDSSPRLIKSLPADATSTVVEHLVPGVTYAFTIEARNGGLRSGRALTSTATTWSEANLHIEAEGRIVSETLVRYAVSIHNAGPEDASAVVVTSALTAAEGSFETSTSGCGGDPGGVPECGLGGIQIGESESFTIDVAIDAASRNMLTYSGAVSDIADPRPHDETVEVALLLGRPEAPSDLEAAALNGTEVELRWRDNSDRETGFGVFLQGPGDSKLRMIGTVPADTTSMVVNELVPSMAYSFAVEARNDELRSERTPKATATTWTADAARCGEDDALCLGSFQVEVEWDDGKGRMGRGFAERLTADAGDFWFFHPANIELVVKVLDGCAINDHYWVYAAGLTDVGVTMTVRDLRDGVEKSWTNPLGTRFRPITDASAFATCDRRSSVHSLGRIVLSGAPLGRVGELYAASMSTAERIGLASSACASDDARLCLVDSRFEVRADWEAGGQGGVATAIPRTTDTGMFWFFSSDNVELVVKVLDGCRENGYRWVLIGGLTDVGAEVTVTDTESGRAKMYRSLEGRPFATMFDVTAFACDAGR